MKLALSFHVCRVCLLPVGFTKLTSLFEGNAENAKKFAAVCGIDVSKSIKILGFEELNFKFSADFQRIEGGYCNDL